MVICHCERLTDRRLAKAIKAGCTSIRALAQQTDMSAAPQ